jgi:Flp pilus assembly pilin Flp
MRKLFNKLKLKTAAFYLNKAGATAVEYALISALVAVAANQAIRATGHTLVCIYQFQVVPALAGGSGGSCTS